MSQYLLPQLTNVDGRDTLPPYTVYYSKGVRDNSNKVQSWVFDSAE